MIAASVFQKMSIKEGDERAFKMEWAVPADLPYLQGHFPGNPVFPAVAIVDASFYALQLKFPTATLQAIENAKFLSLIQPGHPLSIEFTLLSEQVWQVEWKDRDQQKLFATLRLRLGNGALTS